MLVAGKATSRQVRGEDQVGRPIARNVVVADFAPRCTDQRVFGGEAVSSPGNMVDVTMKAPCRRCEACLRNKRAQWALRCVHENQRAVKTYFTTLTLAPDAWVLIDARARNRAWEADDETGELVNRWDQWTDHQRSWFFFLELGKEVTKYLKRLRKSLAPYCKLRYSMFNEKGDENEREHVHLLVHIYPDPVAVKCYGPEYPWDAVWWHQVRAWKFYEIAPRVPLGIATSEQVRHAEKGGWYVAGYLQDSSHNRARASLRYGPPRSPTGKPPLVGSQPSPGGVPCGEADGKEDVT